MLRNLSAVDASMIFRILLGDREVELRATSFQLSEARNGNYIRANDFASFLTRNQINLHEHTRKDTDHE